MPTRNIDRLHINANFLRAMSGEFRMPGSRKPHSLAELAIVTFEDGEELSMQTGTIFSRKTQLAAGMLCELTCRYNTLPNKLSATGLRVSDEQYALDVTFDVQRSLLRQQMSSPLDSRSGMSQDATDPDLTPFTSFTVETDSITAVSEHLALLSGHFFNGLVRS